jgi:hypothetical protein
MTFPHYGHPGQILTYTAGTNLRTVVWITTGFRLEHRAALDWLNEHTGPDTRFRRRRPLACTR